MTNFLLLPPTNPQYQTIVANGRSYHATPGSTLSVPDFDAAILLANSWTKIEVTGTTAQRPAKPSHGNKYFDSTLGVTITFDGANWRDPATGNAV
ncbi:MAG TPA: hypothetical protein VFE60_28315 [Roseiarcus sp.]|nr:hypothetical protein [Roseiarcus sp.]